jgi:hypothetical protein
MTQPFPEPGATPFAEYLPSVRVGAGVGERRWVDYLRDQTATAFRASRALKRTVAEVVGTAQGDARIRLIDEWVRKNIKHGGSLVEAATVILARRSGNRTTLLKAMLGAAGIEASMLLAGNIKAAFIGETPGAGALPYLEAFDQPVLVTSLGPIDSRLRHSTPGLMSPLVRGARALRLEAGDPIAVDVAARSSDRREVELDAKLDAHGSAEVRVVERLTGWPALEWREAIEQIAPDRLRAQFEQQTLGYYFPGAALASLKWTGMEQRDGELIVEYNFTHPSFARRVESRLVVPAPYAAMLGRRYVQVATRRTPLQLDPVAPTHLRAHVTLPEGSKVIAPPAVALEIAGARFKQAASASDGALVLDAQFEMKPTRVAPAGYSAFVEFVDRVDRAEARAAEIELRR